MKKLLCPRMDLVGSSMFASAALLAMRLVAGSAFAQHGFGKIQSPFAWMGPDAGTPGIFQALAAVSEFGGGIAWMLGLLTPLSSFGILSTMTVAVFTHLSKGDGMIKGYELAAVYWTIALCLMAIGPGRFSLDFLAAKRCGKCSQDGPTSQG